MLSLSRMNKQHRNAGLLTQPVCMLSEAASVSSLLLRSTCYQGITLGKEGLPQKSIFRAHYQRGAYQSQLNEGVRFSPRADGTFAWLWSHKEASAFDLPVLTQTLDKGGLEGPMRFIYYRRSKDKLRGSQSTASPSPPKYPPSAHVYAGWV